MHYATFTIHSLAEFQETESTCGAATCTVTAIEGGADNDWSSASEQSASEKIMAKLWARKQRAEKDLAKAIGDYSNGEISLHELKTKMENCVRSGIDADSSQVYADAQIAFIKVLLAQLFIYCLPRVTFQFVRRATQPCCT